MKELTENEALNKAAAYCSSAEHCESEVRDKLDKWGIDADTTDSIVQRLIREKFISDARYANAYARDKMRFAGWGKKKIALMLRAKDIDSTIISEALDNLDMNEYEEILRTLLRNKEKSIRYDSEYERKGKLLRYAAGRGFEPALAARCLGTSPEDYE